MLLRIVHEDDKDRLWGQTGMSYSNIISVSDRQRIELAGTYFTFLHTPGHTAGSVCVLACLEREWNGRNSVLIGGDTLFPVGELGGLMSCLPSVMTSSFLYRAFAADATCRTRTTRRCTAAYKSHYGACLKN